MAKLNSPIKNLNRFFERLDCPVYILSPESRIIYVNAATCQWLNHEESELLGLRCVYSSHTLQDDSENLVQGLSPAPEIFSQNDLGQPSHHAPVFTRRAGKTFWRSASFQRLQDMAGTFVGVLALCSSNETDAPLIVGEKESQTLENPELLLRELHNQSLQDYQLETLVGVSPFAKRLRRQVSHASESDCNLLVYGPAGSGKEHIARTIHAERSTRKTTHLLTVHGSITDQRQLQRTIRDMVDDYGKGKHLESEPTESRLLLLDADRLDAGAQVELLGFFQLPDFPLRVLSTSTLNLVQLATDSRYSLELAYTLSTTSLEVAPLSQRVEDIPLIAQLFLERANENSEVQHSGFSKEALNLLTEFHWPENIDQLKRTIELATDQATDHEINENHLPAEFHHAVQAMRIGKPTQDNLLLDEFLLSIERELVDRAIVQANGNKTKAAKLLGISRAKLLRRIQQLGLNIQVDVAANQDVPQLEESDFQELDP